MNKRRSKKIIDDDEYFEESMKKINELNEKLRTAKADGLNVKER